MFCCSDKNRKRGLLPQKKEIQILQDTTLFTEKEIRELRQQFMEMSKNTGYLTMMQFRDCMGILGLENVQFLSDRIFNIMADPNGHINFQNFIVYLNTIMNGDERDKILMSFRLIDDKNKGYFEKEDLAMMIKSIVNSWAAITQTNLNQEIIKIINDSGFKNRIKQFLGIIYFISTRLFILLIKNILNQFKYYFLQFKKAKEMLNKVDKQINHIFKVMDIKNQDKVDEQDFCQSLQKYPDLLEIFDFLNKGVTDTVVHNDHRSRELQIARELSHIEKFLESINAYLIGEGFQLLEINLINQDQIHQKIDFCNKDQYNRAPSFQEIQKKLHPFGTQNEVNNQERQIDDSIPLNIDKGIDISHQIYTLNNLQFQNLKQSTAEKIQFKQVGKELNDFEQKNVPIKNDINKNKITHSLSVDLINKQNENMHYMQTEQDQQNPQNSNYRSNISEYGSLDKKQFDDNYSNNHEKAEGEEKTQKQIQQQLETNNASNHQKFLQIPMSSLQNTRSKSQDSNNSQQNATFQPTGKNGNSPNNTLFGTITTPQINSSGVIQNKQQIFNIQGNSTMNSDVNKQNTLLQSPILGGGGINAEISINRNSLASNHRRNFSSQSNSNNDADTAQFLTSLNNQQYWLSNLQQSKQPDYIMEGSNIPSARSYNNSNPNQNLANKNSNHIMDAMNTTFQHKQFMNASTSNQEFNQVGASFQVPLKGLQENFMIPEKRRSSLFQNGVSVMEKSSKLYSSKTQPLNPSTLLSPIQQAQNTSQLLPVSPIILDLKKQEEEQILKKYESVMCGDCIYRVTQKFKLEQQKEQKRLSSVMQQKKLATYQSQSPQNYSQIPRQNQTPQTKVMQNNSQTYQSGTQQQIKLNNSNYFLDPSNHTMRTKLSRIAQKFLGDLDEIESCCVGSDDDEYRKKNYAQNLSPPPPPFMNTFQYIDPINPKKGDSGLFISDKDIPKSHLPNQIFNQNLRQFSSSSNVNEAAFVDSQIKGREGGFNYQSSFQKQFTDEITNRIIKFDDTDYSRMNSPDQNLSPQPSNLASFYEQKTETVIGGNKKSSIYSQQGTATFAKQAINSAYNTAKLTNIQGYQLKYPNSSHRMFGKSNTVEYGRQPSTSLGNAVSIAQQFQHKTKSNQVISPPQPDDPPVLNTEDIEIEVSANALRIGNKFIQSEVSIKELNTDRKNYEQQVNPNQIQKGGTFNAINIENNAPIDPTQYVYVDSYNTNSKNIQSISSQKKNKTPSHNQLNSIQQSNSSNRRIINVTNLKSQKEFETVNSEIYQQTPNQASTALLKKLEAEQMINSMSHDLTNKLQFGGKNVNDKSQIGGVQQSRDANQNSTQKYQNKNLDATAAGVINTIIDHQENNFGSNDNLLQNQQNGNHLRIPSQQTQQRKKLFSERECDLVYEEDNYNKRQKNIGKISQILSQSSSNERISQYMQIQQIERIQTNSPTHKGSYNQTNYQDSNHYDIQYNQRRDEQAEGFNNTYFLNTKSPQHNIYSVSKNGVNPLMMKSQAIPYNNNRPTFPQEQFKVQSTILSPSRNNSRVQTTNPMNSIHAQEKQQINFIQYIMEMSSDELKKRVLGVYSYVKEVSNYIQTIRRSIETNLTARLSEKQGSNIYNNQSRKRSQENKNQSFNKLQGASPINNKQQINLVNQSVQGRYQNPQQTNITQQLNQSGILNNKTPPLQPNPHNNDEDTIRISTISNIQKKLPKQKEPRKPKLMVFFGHQNWNLVVNMMMGIQMSVQSAASNVILNENNTMPDLQSRDFKVKYLFELLPRKDNFEKEWSYKVCKFQDYAPNVFQRIRMFYNITDEQYLKSLGPNQLFNLGKGGLNSFSQLTSTGKSGSFFYYTADGQFTLKTVSRAEFHHLKFILRNYYEHVKENRNSLIIKFFGLHKIKIRMKKSTKVEIVYIVIMGNVFHTTKLINERYDLKGSTYGRTTKVRTQGVTMKDLDFLENKTKIQAKYDEYEEFMSIVKKDAQFFEENNIIDYSMLVGIHYNFTQNQEQSDQVSYTIRDQLSRAQYNKDGRQVRNISTFCSRDNKLYYLFGIIDILTCFNAKKKFEYIAKRIAFGPNISAIPPTQYSQRFVKFMEEMFDDDSKVPPELKQ